MVKYLIKSSVLKEFCQRCDALCASKLILADKKISNILKTIASDEDFCRFIKECLENFNYSIEFLKSKKPHSEKKDKFILSLPKEETLIAYVFCLLCDFENKEKDLTRFLIEYYDFNDLFADGYKNFCNAVIIPFKNTVMQLCSEEEQVTIPAPHKNDTLNISKEQYLLLNRAYQELARNIDKEGRLGAEERKHYRAVADAFINACNEGDSPYAMPLFYALKYICSDYKFLKSKVRQIEKVINGK